MEIESYPPQEKLSSEEDQEMGGWEETKENDNLPPSQEEIQASLEKVYGSAIDCTFSEDKHSFAMCVHEEYISLTPDMLQNMLPKGSYDALAGRTDWQEASRAVGGEESMTEMEKHIRTAFQEDREISPEYRSLLWALRNPVDPGQRVLHPPVGTKRTRK